MPRDFVPVLYDEWDSQDDVTQTWHRTYRLVEGFQMADRETTEPYITLSGDSHRYHVGIADTATARSMGLTAETRYLETRMHLFTLFYAAMAALE